MFGTQGPEVRILSLRPYPAIPDTAIPDTAIPDTAITVAVIRRIGFAVMVLSGSAASAMLLLPLMLVALITLFDTMAHSLLVLLGTLLETLLRLLPMSGDGGLSPYRSIMADPQRVAFASLARAMPCITGLLLVTYGRQPQRWFAVLLLWGLTARIGGVAVAAILLPGIIVSGLFAMPISGLRRR